MDAQYITGTLGVLSFSIITTYFLVRNRFKKQIAAYRSISDAVEKTTQKLTQTETELTEAQQGLETVRDETKELQDLKENAGQLKAQLEESSKQLEEISVDIESKEDRLDTLDGQLHQLMSKVDLYSRVDEFVEHGLFEEPEYLFETTERFAEEIKRTREKQKELIKNKEAVTLPSSLTVSSDKRQGKKILEGQVKLMLTTFNIECDLLIGKVNPGNFARALERIEKLAATLEKSAATLHCGFNIEFVRLKFEECRQQYQYKLKKQEEQEEQRLIREQMREEQKAIKEYERALAQAEKEERVYRDILERVRNELEQATAGDRLLIEQRIADLERQLAEAEAKEERAKSMAEQTRRGHVYIISNLGSFGENVYKIGLTRRLEPLDRVKELGDASVPFSFDVHALIYSDDAPALEKALHRKFAHNRVNVVNLRKEFFRTEITAIKEAVEKITNGEADFKLTAVAEEYYESRRLQRVET